MPPRDLRPRTVEELLQRIEARIRGLEARRRVVIGASDNAYVLEVDAAGQLTARHTRTGTVTVVAAP